MTEKTSQIFNFFKKRRKALADVNEGPRKEKDIAFQQTKGRVMSRKKMVQLRIVASKFAEVRDVKILKQRGKPNCSVFFPRLEFGAVRGGSETDWSRRKVVEILVFHIRDEIKVGPRLGCKIEIRCLEKVSCAQHEKFYRVQWNGGNWGGGANDREKKLDGESYQCARSANPKME